MNERSLYCLAFLQIHHAGLHVRAAEAPFRDAADSKGSMLAAAIPLTQLVDNINHVSRLVLRAETAGCPSLNIEVGRSCA